MVRTPMATVNVWTTGTAAVKLVLPACKAWTVQVPLINNVSIAPDTVHTGKVVDLKVTARPEDAVAFKGNRPVPSDWLEIAPKVMVWLAGVTVKCWVTEGAGA